MRKRLIIVGGILLASILICVGYLYFDKEVYNLARNWLTAETHGEFLREIGTNIDLWRNGYLGIFFRFKMFGVLNWLAFPLFIYFLITLRKRERWEIALGLVLSTSFIFICIQGYANYRYQLTLHPILLTIIFLFGWQVLKKQKRKVIGVIILFCSFILFLNCYSLRESYQYYWNKGIGNGKPGERFPYKLIEYINNNVTDDSVILERDQPMLYYHTSKKKKLGGGDQRKGKYILLNGGSSLAAYAYDLVCGDQGLKLYKIREKPDKLTIEYFNEREPDFETNFSGWTGKDEVSIDDISKTLVHMVDLGRRGEYVFKRISSENAENGNIARLMLQKPWFNKESKIQFGYYINPNGLKLKVKEGDIVSFVARMRLHGPKGRTAELFVQDKTDYWVREKIYYKGNSWRNVLVSKKIREGFTEICLGIYWKPVSTDEWLDVKSVRIFVGDKDKQLQVR